jgi:hypothetical protein
MTYKLLLALVASYDSECHQADIKGTFLHALMERIVYVQQPLHFNEGKGLVCRLLSALYGLPESPLLWLKIIGDYLRQFGWHQLESDPWLFIKNQDIIVIYVNNMLLIARRWQR